MSTNQERNGLKEQLRRSRSAAHLGRRLRKTKTPRGRYDAYMDFITAYMAHANEADQRTVMNQMRAIAEGLKRGR